MLLERTGFVGILSRFVGFMGKFVGFILGFVEVVGSSLILSLGSLIIRAVRWICPGFVEFIGCSLI